MEDDGKGLAGWEGSPLAGMPQEDAEAVRVRLRRIKAGVRTSRQESETARMEYDTNVEYLKGEQETGAIKTDMRTNLLLPKFFRLIAHLFSREPDVVVEPANPADVVNNMAEEELRAGARLNEALLKAVMREGMLKEAGKAAVRDSRTGGYGIIKVHQPKRDPESLSARAQADRLNAMNAAMRIGADSQDPELSEDDKQELAAKAGEHGESIHQSPEVRRLAPEIVFERIPFKDFAVDSSITEFHNYEQATFMDQQNRMLVDDFKAAFPNVPMEVINANMGMESKMSDRPNMSRERPPQNSVVVHETWVRETSTIYMWIEGSQDPIIEPRAIETTTRFYPFFLLPDMIVPGQFTPVPSVSMWRPSQNRADMCDAKLDGARRGIKAGFIAGRMSDASLRAINSAKDGDTVAIDDAMEGGVRDHIIPRVMPQVDPLLFDKGVPRQDLELSSGDQDPARAQAGQRTATAAQNIELSRMQAQEHAQKDIEAVLRDALQYSLELALRYYMPEHLMRLGIDHERWPSALAALDHIKAFKVSVRDGSIGSVDMAERQEAIINLANNLLPIVGMIEQYEVSRLSVGQGLPPEEAAKFVHADHLRNLVKEFIKRFDPSIDPNMFMPPPITGLPPQAAQKLIMDMETLRAAMSQGMGGAAQQGGGSGMGMNTPARPGSGGGQYERMQGQGQHNGVTHPVQQPAGGF